MKKIIGFICVSIFCCNISASVYMEMARVENNKIICKIKNDSSKCVNISASVTDSADESIVDESFSVFGDNLLIRPNASNEIEVSSIDAKSGHNYMINITGNSNSKITVPFVIDNKYLLLKETDCNKKRLSPQSQKY